MRNKINIAELLKYCPIGMELDCAMYNNVTFVEVNYNRPNFPIVIREGDRLRYFTEYGCYQTGENCKCVLFPKGKTTWEGFQRPFKEGDVIVVEGSSDWILIYKETLNDAIYKHVSFSGSTFSTDINPVIYIKDPFFKSIRFATEEEQEKLFKAIKEHGYTWNAETKTLEKLGNNAEFDLLLKDLSARVSNGTKCHITHEGKEFDGVLMTISAYGECAFNYGIDLYSLDCVKPYLFPMSNMTEEMEEELRGLCWFNCLDYLKPIAFDWLNENHIDYRGLVEKGLAVDATNKNIYIV